jgi:hypothetical protein
MKGRRAGAPPAYPFVGLASNVALRPGPIGALLRVRKNSGSKKSKVQKLGRDW